jgi:hypothetical protein
MRRREQMFGIAEKLPKMAKGAATAMPRRKVVALEARRIQKRR